MSSCSWLRSTKISVAAGSREGAAKSNKLPFCHRRYQWFFGNYEVGQEEMLKIEKQVQGCATRLQLSGRFGSDLIAFVRSVMSNGCARKILDLSQITLVDLEVVRFLFHCEDEGIELVH